MTTELLVESYHRKNLPKWDGPRVSRLCGFLEVRPSELASLLLIQPASLEKYMKSGKFPGPVKLLLSFIERCFLRGAVDDVSEGKVIPLHLFALQDRQDCPVCGKEII